MVTDAHPLPRSQRVERLSPDGGAFGKRPILHSFQSRRGKMEYVFICDSSTSEVVKFSIWQMESWKENLKT